MKQSNKGLNNGVITLLVAAAASLGVATAHAATWVSGGYTYSEYGDDSSSVTVPVRVRWSSQAYALAVSSGWQQQDDGSSALSDTFLSAALYDLVWSDTCRCGADLQGGVKLPTAAADVGTGETDVQAGATVYRAFDHAFVFLSYDYRINGDSATVDNVDYSLWSAGTVIRLTSPLSVGLFYDHSVAQSEDVPDSDSVSAFLAWQASTSLVVKGFCSSSLSGDDEGAYSTGVALDFRI